MLGVFNNVNTQSLHSFQQQCTHMNTIGADECDAAFALNFLLTALVKISLPVLFYFLECFCYQTFEKWYPNWRKFVLYVLILRRSNIKDHSLKAFFKKYCLIARITCNSVPHKSISSNCVQIVSKQSELSHCKSVGSCQVASDKESRIKSAFWHTSRMQGSV